jgi:hypothetical protein
LAQELERGRLRLGGLGLHLHRRLSGVQKVHPLWIVSDLRKDPVDTIYRRQAGRQARTLTAGEFRQSMY